MYLLEGLLKRLLFQAKQYLHPLERVKTVASRARARMYALERVKEDL